MLWLLYFDEPTSLRHPPGQLVRVVANFRHCLVLALNHLCFLLRSFAQLKDDHNADQEQSGHDTNSHRERDSRTHSLSSGVAAKPWPPGSAHGACLQSHCNSTSCSSSASEQ